MAITSYQRGHPIIFENGTWLYQDDRTTADIERPCVVCKLMPTPEGYDPCLGYVEGATSACCGHGVENGYIIKRRNNV